ncbi:hypothetical protein MJO29_012913 [Puccinia striiformis f. sp. tritici]|uniref:hypothetical protein n=1 Tax=Puccinia striiformis f. sp. tritici TaxID=168172 RepID=UPI002007FD10|nr:hypothetical protein Pst134EA_024357 [Puccinia striiformis f. sp. tritici]KAH9453486.1 hypothetical protein Pst134EA_024357 [Puccinia striiformis f. sp. tritici]KAI7943069.1 hypothetical protein MJO29_012913 [Puccinia striiformis f. sp. tritici]
MRYFVSLPLIIGQYVVMGMHSPTPELASLERETRFGYRDGPFYSSSPPRAVEPLPVNGFTIDIPSSDDVKSYDGGKSYDGVKSYYDIKSYDEMTRWYDAQHKPSPPKKSAINTYPVDEYARGIPLTSEVAFIRNRDIWDTNSEACCYIKLGCWVFGVLAVITAAILLTLWRIAYDQQSTSIFIVRHRSPRRRF